LPNGLGSGKGLLVGTNPLTGEVTTVIRSSKNLINKILREQDDIAITKQRFKIINTIIKHAIVAILTITLSIPVIYWTINASLEATINNYRHSQTIFQTLYKENGKINMSK